MFPVHYAVIKPVATLIRQLPFSENACQVDDLRGHLDVAGDVEDGDGDLHRTRDKGWRVC